MNDAKNQIEEIVETIYQLVKSTSKDWITWSKLSKKIHGSDEYIPSIQAYTNLPQWKHLFAKTNKAVKLTEDGIIFLGKIKPKENQSQIHIISSAVKNYASTLDDIKIKVINISRVAKVSNKFVTSVEIELTDALLPTSTPIKFAPIYESETRGTIVGQELDNNKLFIATESEIFPSSLPAILIIDRAFLLLQLFELLSNLKEIPIAMKQILNNVQMTGLNISAIDSKKIAHDLFKLTPPWSRFLWGPPGGGKTFSISELTSLILEKYEDEKILILAPSNRAVDVVIEEISNKLKESRLHKLLKERKILRYGYPRKAEVLDSEHLAGPVDVIELTNQIKKLSKRLNQAEKDHLSDSQLSILKTELLALQEEIKSKVFEHVKQCRVVATTVTLAYLSTSPISKIQWDNIFIDEATMVTPATFTYLASLTTKRFLLSGDPRQLGPIFEESKHTNLNIKNWMGTDIFELSGISKPKGIYREIATEDMRLARIVSQRRCAHEIWAKVKSMYPSVKNISNSAELKRSIDLPPAPGKSVIILNTHSNFNTAFCKKIGQSWQNQEHAEIAIEIATTIAAEIDFGLSIAIITPYRAQVKLIKQYIKHEKEAEKKPFGNVNIQVGTVHQFQGSAADIVIFDIVDGLPRKRIGNLLREDSGIRLVNVAITRAKGKFICIADKVWAKERNVEKDNPLLWSVLNDREYSEQLEVIPAKPDSYLEQISKCESPIEKILYEAILEYPEIKNIEPQFKIWDGEKIVSRADFAFPNLKLAIYCDGRQWHLIEDKWQRDIRQRNKLTELGWKFLVFTGYEINHNPQKCAKQILKTYLSYF